MTYLHRPLEHLYSEKNNWFISLIQYMNIPQKDYISLTLEIYDELIMVNEALRHTPLTSFYKPREDLITFDEKK